jgi:hypothetical protein
MALPRYEDSCRGGGKIGEGGFDIGDKGGLGIGGAFEPGRP